MAGAKAVWGIDIGRCALKAIKLRVAAEGEVEMVAHDYVEHPKILSQPDADKEELVSQALEKFLSRNDISSDRVAISVPGQQTLARFTKLPPVEEKKIPDIVKYEADQQIPFDMDEVIWDYQTFKDEEMPDVEVGIFAMKREQIRAHMLPFEQLGIEPILVQSGPLAVYNAVYHEGWLKPAETTIVLDIGAEAADLIVSTTTGLWTRTIPIGGNRFTEALVKSFKLSFSKAEKLKQEAAKSRYARQIFQAMRPVFADLVQELQRSMGFYASTHRGAKIERVIVLGNACKLPGLVKYLQQNLGYEVVEPTEFKKLVGTEAAKAPQFVSEILSYAVPYGLALQALEQSKITSSLLPLEIAKQVVWQKKRPFLAAAAACLLLAGGTTWLRYNLDITALARTSGGAPITAVSDDQAEMILQQGPQVTLAPRQRAQQILVAAQNLKRRFNELHSKGEAEQKQSELLVELQGDKSLVPGILQTIHAALPQNDKPYGNAASVEEYLGVIKGAPPIPRADREEIQVANFDFEFLIGMSQVDLPASKVTIPPNFDLGEGDAIDGFYVRMVCTTAHKDSDKFIQRFVQRLLDTGKEPGRGYFINRVHLTGWYEVGAERLRGEVAAAEEKPKAGAPAAKAPSGGGGRGLAGEREEMTEEQKWLEAQQAGKQGRGGGMPTAPGRSSRPQVAVAQAKPTPNSDKNLDYVTEEDVSAGVLEFTVVLDVLMGEPPVEKEAEGNAEGEEPPSGKRDGDR
ncbi:MAG: type IV pilus assembly protein PilM [Phycisphaerales bacterium]|nr:type IV pilus assembly protein PilM [Phycisphaerales bacterium]